MRRHFEHSGARSLREARTCEACTAGGLALAAVAALLATLPYQAARSAVAQAPPVPIVYLSREDTTGARSTLLDPVIADYGWQGAKFAVDEINVNGRFLGRSYQLIKVIAPPGGDIASTGRKALADGHALIVADLKAADLLALAALPEAKGALILDGRTSDDSLRTKDCRSNVLHILPSWAMRADALAQFLARKHWTRWLVIKGVAPLDQEYVAAIRRAASKVGAKIVDEKPYQYQAASAEVPGREQIQSELTTATHIAAAYDAIFVADTTEAFGEFLPFNSWEPRPVFGTQGLTAAAWNFQFREYAARGMQYRFHLAASRDMTERDYATWLAVAIIGEAIARGGKTDAGAVKSYLLSDQFSMPAYKGEGLKFRRWDNQLGQPVLLFGPKTLVSMWPPDTAGGPKLQMGMLGASQSESACHLTERLRRD
jgi:ABC transporter substrate binding protein (PQQ-dependent alcohol dehydrogenase system)